MEVENVYCENIYIIGDNLGKPFNRDNEHSVAGHGLGLAWVKTICKKYDWDLSISNVSGTQVVITFKDFL